MSPLHLETHTHTHTHTRSFQHRGLECKSKKSRDTWSNRQVWFWGKKWSRAKANRILQREHIGHSKHLLPKHKRWLYTWASPDGQYQNQIDYILCSQRGRSSIQLAKTRLETDYGSEHELLIAKFRLIWTTGPFRYDQIKSLMIIQEVTNRFKGLDLIDRMPEELWTFVTLHRRWLSRPSPRKKCRKAK